ncbi:phosphate propanoyltransferase [Acetobacterium paludosum]|uniref:Phosphate propanoyltransferase n=2 Tax=Acetobacterium TaxID=33951 RepID=A0A923HXS9_9FIRM|nr:MULTISPECIES: phosphate propanoyltransferase [Acetobacterium]MBC3797453.1 phosphate propanoyltransferase [Acetobacterium tundrae]MBC3889107.1 phosphate propanoyltransferase [Acetobacterium paludosum]
MERKVPIGLSNKHIHLSQTDLEALFGKGYQLTPMKDLSQPGQFACEEKVDVVGPKGKQTMRILGPVRPETQIEVSIGDGFVLGLKVPIRNSGDIDGTPGVKIVGPAGEIEIGKGVLVAGRHIHMSPDEAKTYNLKDKDVVSVKLDGPRGLTFDNVLVRVNPNYLLDMHIDVEEGNAAGAKNGQTATIL